MKRRDINLHVSDLAVLRYLEHRHGVDIEAVRSHLAGLAVNAAQLGAIAVRADTVRLFLRDTGIGQGQVHVMVTSVGPAERHRGADQPERDHG